MRIFPTAKQSPPDDLAAKRHGGSSSSEVYLLPSASRRCLLGQLEDLTSPIQEAQMALIDVI
jgi:hypothetical protein